jgi:hypothetical protein
MYDNIHVEISPPIGIDEIHLNKDKKLIKVVGLMGRETEIRNNTTLVYIYDDGTTERVFRVE